MTETEWTWRDEVRSDDKETVRRLCASSGFFSAEEIAMAAELVEERLAKGPSSGYHFVFAEREGRASGYVCYGQVPCTEASWDLYWIVVDQAMRGGGLGKRLQADAERRIAAFGGRRVYAWTSSREQYVPTRAFYERTGYTREAALRDFYKPGDDLVIYVKEVSKVS
jgi:GNAT superfamily N-acetyltransferase